MWLVRAGLVMSTVTLPRHSTIPGAMAEALASFFARHSMARVEAAVV
jgi:hypothetical protein